MDTGNPRLNFCPAAFTILGDIRAGELGFGNTIFPLSVSQNTAVRNLPISSSFVIPIAAIFAERVRRGITTPSNTRSSALTRLFPAIAVTSSLDRSWKRTF